MGNATEKPEGLKASEADAVKPEKAAAEKPMPPEGPHARPDLINEDATPGTGLFPTPKEGGGDDVDPGAG